MQVQAITEVTGVHVTLTKLEARDLLNELSRLAHLAAQSRKLHDRLSEILDPGQEPPF
jgi:hypothetical protein